VWVEGIYGRKDRRYGNYMAQLHSPYHDAVPQTNRIASPARVYPNPAMKYTSFEFTVSKEQAFTFLISDMQGRVVDKVTEHYCREGKNIIYFNTAPLASGTYLLKAIGAQGEQIAVHTLVVTR
jgi:hypothetical protein